MGSLQTMSTTTEWAASSRRADREPLHLRQIDLQGYRRSDGLFEVEGRLRDTKPFDFRPPSDGRLVPAQTPVHDMWVRVVFDGGLIVQSVQTSMDAFPYETCPGGGGSLQALVGIRIGAGWGAEVRRALPAADTCTHLREILVPLASAVFQSMTIYRSDMVNATDPTGRPLKIDSCHAYGASRALVQRRWPMFHRDASTSDGGAGLTRSESAPEITRREAP
ncbi:MAG: DUF2889 domain-containing protein [Rhodoferax sp.]|nr:DUF2889 domain-containing protein [Rhodoferax sp.]